MANTIRVHELANELRKSLREVTDRLRKLEISYKTNLSSITQQDANRVRKSFDRPLVKIEKPKKKPAKKPAAKKPAKKAEKKPAAKKPAKKAEKKPAARKPAKKAEKKPAARKPAKAPAAKKPAAVKTVPAAPMKPAEPGVKERVKVAEPPKQPAVDLKPPVQERPAAKAGHVPGRTAATAAAPARKAPAAPAKKPERAEGPAKSGTARVKPAPAHKAPEKKAPGPGGPPPQRTTRPRPAGAAARPEAGPARRETAPPRRGVPQPARPGEKPRQKRTLRVAPPDRRQGGRPKQAEKKVYRFVPKGRGAAKTGSPPTTVAPKLLRVPSGVTVKDFAQKAGLTPAEVIRKLMSFGEMLTVNQAISDDAMKLLSEDLGIEIKIKAMTRIDEFEEISDRDEDLKSRPAVVTVMGHVDHGKTLLLDTIRKTDVVSTEMGGITQHIGAYQVVFRGKPITFIDTPGHESFTAMRARGAQATDVVVLVVAADDGVMPQTVEALDHALDAQVPIIVAVNKIDKQGADPHRARQQLSERGLIPEDWGGETVFVDVSAKAGTNIDHLLEMVLLVAEMQELKANPDAEAGGVVVEAKLDKARGPVVTVLVQRGTARVGDVVAVGTAWGKIRAMFDDRGETVEQAGPSFPVEILGLSSLPMAGDEFRVVADEKKARQIADKRRMHVKLEDQVAPERHVSLENLFERIKEGELNQLKVVLKADTKGSLEAIVESLEKLSMEEVKLNVIRSGVGGIAETDIMLASASDAIVLGFNVRPDGKASHVAERETVDVRTYQVIYQLTEDMEAALKGMLAPVFAEEILGRAEVRQTFRVPGMGTIAGSYVLEGEVARSAQARALREGIVVHDGKIGSLRRFKDDVRTVAAGFECGIGLEDFNDLKEGDVLEVYRMREVPR